MESRAHCCRRSCILEPPTVLGGRGCPVLRFPGEEPGFGKTDRWLLPVREQEDGHRVWVGPLQPRQVSRTVRWVRDLPSKPILEKVFSADRPIPLSPEEPEA